MWDVVGEAISGWPKTWRLAVLAVIVIVALRLVGALPALTTLVGHVHRL
jgi:hypothetical protein